MTAKQEREARLAAQLRANLRKRKAAGRDQGSSTPVVPSDGEGQGVSTALDTNGSD